jgi:hypothetical protein
MTFQKGDLVKYVGLRSILGNHDSAIGVVVKVTGVTAGSRGSALVYWSSQNKKILTSFCYMRKIA